MNLFILRIIAEKITRIHTLINISLAFVQRIELNFGLGVWTSAEVTKERSQVGTSENKLYDRCLSKKGEKSETLHLSS